MIHDSDSDDDHDGDVTMIMITMVIPIDTNRKCEVPKKLCLSHQCLHDSGQSQRVEWQPHDLRHVGHVAKSEWCELWSDNREIIHYIHCKQSHPTNEYDGVVSDTWPFF